MKKLFILFFILVLLSCSNNQKTGNELSLLEDVNSIEIQELELPNWFLNMPAGDFSVGIAATYSYDPQVTQDKIKEKGSILAQRKKSSIVITKLKMKENERTKTPILTDFKLQVASDIPALKNYFTSCDIFNSYQTLGMTIGLIGNSSQKVVLDTLRQTINQVPAWFTENRISSKDDWLISCGTYTADNMITAYNEAYNDAVYNLIAGIKPQVKGSLISSDKFQEKFVEIDASLIIENIKNTRNSLLVRKSQNAWVFDAFVELKWQAKYQITNIEVKN
jgi:hypothetical protein